MESFRAFTCCMLTETAPSIATLRPDLPQGILMKSMLAAQKGRFAEAITDIQTLLHSDPQNPDYRLQLATYMVADKRPRRAIEVLDGLIEADAKNADALRARGDALLSIGKHAEAIADYENAMKVDDEDTGVLIEEGESDSEAVFRGTLDFQHQLTPNTSVIDKFIVEAGADNTYLQNDLSLQVKMTDVLALAVGYSVKHNTDPPVGFEETDTLTTVNLVYLMK